LLASLIERVIALIAFGGPQMSLKDELTRVREYLLDSGKRPNNEANTCHWVITPLLLQCGYDFHEIDVQTHDTAGKFPDYAVMPGTTFAWFLEAKAWQENLADTHVIQAMNYAHTQGRRWVVLSNGREWRLYDDHIIGVQPANRMVASARLDCAGELESLLTALNKASIHSGDIGVFATRQRLAPVLSQQLRTPGSEVIKAITSTLKNKLALPSVTMNDVASYFEGYDATGYSNNAAVPPLPVPPKVHQSSSEAPRLTPGSQSLGQLQELGIAIQGRKPKTISFPDKTEKPVTSWRDVAVETTGWLFANYPMANLPFRGRKGGKLYFINTSKFHSSGTEMRYKAFQNSGQTLYMDVNRSASDFISCLNVLCKEVGAPPSEFHVTLRK